MLFTSLAADYPKIYLGGFPAIYSILNGQQLELLTHCRDIRSKRSNFHIFYYPLLIIIIQIINTIICWTLIILFIINNYCRSRRIFTRFTFFKTFLILIFRNQFYLICKIICYTIKSLISIKYKPSCFY